MSARKLSVAVALGSAILALDCEPAAPVELERSDSAAPAREPLDAAAECPAASLAEMVPIGEGAEPARLRAALRRGPALLSVTACGARVVDSCRLDGATLVWKALALRDWSSSFTSTELLPWLGARSTPIDLNATISGEHQFVQTGQLTLRGQCDEVTHYITRVEVGVFDVSLNGMNRRRAGVLECCEDEERAACDVPLRLELASTDGLDRAPEAVSIPAVQGNAGFRDSVEIAGAPGQPSFALDRFEVTRDGYRACVEAGVCPAGYNLHGPLPAELDRCAAEAFCAWVGGRLPSQSEWLWAARGGEQNRRYPWGDYPPTGRLAAWNPDGQTYGFVGPLPVGSLPAGASRDGILDMAGNLSEWVIDEHGHAIGLGGEWSTSELDYANIHGIDASGARCAYPGDFGSSY